MVSSTKKEERGEAGGGEVKEGGIEGKAPKTQSITKEKACLSQRHAKAMLCGRSHVLVTCFSFLYVTIQATHTHAIAAGPGGRRGAGRTYSYSKSAFLPSLISISHSNSFSHVQSPQKIHPQLARSSYRSIYAAVCAGSSACRKPCAYLARLGWFSCGLCM